MKEIVDLELAKVRERLADMEMVLELTDDAREFIVHAGSNTDYGARPLRRAIESLVEDPLSEELLKGEFSGKNKIVVDAKWDSDHERIERLDFQGEFCKKVAKEREKAIEAALAGSTDPES